MRFFVADVRIGASQQRSTPQNTFSSFRTAFRRNSLGVTAYHDEIKPEHGRRPFLAHGVLLVPDEWELMLVDAMRAARNQHSFYDEIHHREIKAGTPQDKTFLVDQDWLRSYFSRFVKGCSFKAFIVDYEGSQHFPFPGETGFPEHLERSTLSAFLGALAWSFPKEEQIRLRFVSDETDNELERQVLRDLPHALATKWNERQMAKVKRGPWMRASEVEFVSSNPKAVDTAHAIHSEFIQLSDVLLGACFDALELVAPPNKNGRRELSKSVLGAIGETIKVPWLQQVPVHRRFSVSLYPDANNFAYPAALRSVRRHCTLSGARLPGF